MAAEHTMIETMARAIMMARSAELGFEPRCDVRDWEAEARDNPHVAQAVAQACAALFAMLETGPTEQMLTAGACTKLGYGYNTLAVELDGEGIMEIGAGPEARDSYGRDMAVLVFRAMLRAALEEGKTNA